MSNFQLRLLIRLQLEGLNNRMFSNQMIVLNKEEDGVHFTIPDYQWVDLVYAAYLDGPPHLKPHVKRTDDLIDAALDRRGWMVRRLPYKRASRTLEDKFIDIIRQDISSRGYVPAKHY
jgi:hypothetical protein